MKRQDIKWRNGANFSGDPAIAYAEIIRIEKKRGECKPEHLIDEAAKVNNPLHKYFDWDDSSAARKFRLYQARTLIRSITVIYEDAKEPEERTYEVCAFSNLNDRNRNESSPYEQTINIMNDSGKRKQLLDKAKNELRRWRANYAALSEFAALFSLIDDM